MGHKSLRFLPSGSSIPHLMARSASQKKEMPAKKPTAMAEALCMLSQAAQEATIPARPPFIHVNSDHRGVLRSIRVL